MYFAVLQTRFIFQFLASTLACVDSLPTRVTTLLIIASLYACCAAMHHVTQAQLDKAYDEGYIYEYA